MPYIKNPSYNPNDPKSKRYILQDDPFSSSLTKQSTEPKSATITTQQVKAPTIQYDSPLFDIGSTKTKSSTITGVPAPKTTQVAKTTAPNMSVAPAMSVAQKSDYQGGSIVDYLASSGQKSDYNSRAALAKQYGIQNYTGSAVQNTELLNKLRGTGAQSTNIPTTTTQTPPPTAAPGSTTPPPAQSSTNIPNATETAQDGTTAAPTEDIPSTGDPETDNAMQSLAKKAGAAGMSVEDYLAVIKGTSTPTKEESDTIRNNLGIPDLIDEAFGKPSQSTVDIYREQYELSGLSDVKNKIKELDEQIASKRADLVTATGELYNNPWLSQATRSGRLGNLNTIAQMDINNVIAQKQQYLDLYDQGIGEIESEIKRSVFDTGLDRELTVEKLNYLLTEAERDEAFAQRAIEQRALRYLPDFLDSQPTEAAEGFTLGEGQARYDAEGNLIASRAKSTSTGKMWEKVTFNGQDYEQNVETGELRVPQLPANAASEQAAEALNEKLALIDNLITSPGLRGSVGAYGITRFTPFTADKADRQEFASGVQQLINQETIDTLVNLKERGGTLGALSDQERILLQSAATKLASWMQKDENGNPTGKFEVSEDTFKTELERMRTLTQKAIERATGVKQEVTLETHYKRVDETERKKIDKIIAENPNLSDDEIMQVLGFNKELQTSSNGNLQSLKQSIITQESGGDYAAVGIPTKYGNALGKYQIIPQFHFAKVGLNPNSQEDKQKFLNSPDLQDRLFEKIIEELAARYNNDPKKIAAAYYGGDGGVQKLGTPAANERYQGGKSPSINEYVNSVLSRIS